MSTTPKAPETTTTPGDPGPSKGMMVELLSEPRLTFRVPVVRDVQPPSPIPRAGHAAPPVVGKWACLLLYAHGRTRQAVRTAAYSWRQGGLGLTVVTQTHL
jgi:hypothetical protein